MRFCVSVGPGTGHYPWAEGSKGTEVDYTRHPESARFVLEKTEEHIPEWRKREIEQKEKRKTWLEMERMGQESKRDERTEEWSDFKTSLEYEEENKRDTRDLEGEDCYRAKTESDVQRREENRPEQIERVEDLFTDDW